jgi:Kef-type K+ transport system membrane component KefB
VSVGGSLIAMTLISVVIQLTLLAMGVAAGPLEAALFGLSVSLSSLSAVLDYLHAHHLLQSTHAKVMVGMLGFQGLTTGLFFSIPPALANATGTETSMVLVYAILSSSVRLVFVFMFAFILTRYALPPFFHMLISTSDGEVSYLLGVVSVAMCMALLTEHLGLSLDLGAFFAGLMLSELKDTSRTARLIQPLASVFGAMLFGTLGMILNTSYFVKNLDEILMIAILLVLVKGIIVSGVVYLFDYSWRTSIFCGVGLAHVGEFSLLFSSKLQAHNLLSRRAYLLFLAASVATLAMAPLILRLLVLKKFIAFWGGVDVLGSATTTGTNNNSSRAPSPSFDHDGGILGGFRAGGKLFMRSGVTVATTTTSSAGNNNSSNNNTTAPIIGNVPSTVATTSNSNTSSSSSTGTGNSTINRRGSGGNINNLILSQFIVPSNNNNTGTNSPSMTTPTTPLAIIPGLNDNNIMTNL